MDLSFIGWGFTYKVSNGTTPHLIIARFFLTEQLIYCKSKIEKHNVSLDIFVSDTSIAKNLYLPGLEKLFFSYIRTHTIFLIRFCYICVAKNRRTFEDQSLVKEVKRYLHWSMVCTIKIAYGKISSHARP